MKYIVIGSTAILATRDIEPVGQSTLDVTVSGVSDGASFCVQRADCTKSYTVTSEKTEIPSEELSEGTYQVTVLWDTVEDNVTVSHEAQGNPFTIYIGHDGTKNVIPSSLSRSNELEHMWRGIADTLEIILPLIDTLRNGNDVI